MTRILKSLILLHQIFSCIDIFAIQPPSPVDLKLIQFFEFNEWVGSTNTIRGLLNERDRYCAPQAKRVSCLEIGALAEAICKINVPERTHRIRLTWERVFSHFRNTSERARAFEQIKGCSVEPTSGQLMSAFVLVENFIKVDEASLSLKALNWMSDRWKARPNELLEQILNNYSYSLKEILSRTNVDQTIMKRFVEFPLSWFQPKEIAQLPVGTLVLWTSLIAEAMPKLNGGRAFLDKLAFVKLDVMLRESAAWAFRITAVRCKLQLQLSLALRNCVADLKQIKTAASHQPEIVLNVDFLLALIDRKLDLKTMEVFKKRAQIWDSRLYEHLSKYQDKPNHSDLLSIY